MSQNLRTRFALFVLLVFGICQPAWAYKREGRVPIKGCNGYFAATGDAKSLEVRHEPKQKDREELVIELKNVPMKAGTELFVFIGDEDMGKIVLDQRRCGVLKVTSETRKVVPRIEPGTMIEVKTIGGRIVMK